MKKNTGNKGEMEIRKNILNTAENVIIKAGMEKLQDGPLSGEMIS